MKYSPALTPVCAANLIAVEYCSGATSASRRICTFLSDCPYSDDVSTVTIMPGEVERVTARVLSRFRKGQLRARANGPARRLPADTPPFRIARQRRTLYDSSSLPCLN